MAIDKMTINIETDAEIEVELSNPTYKGAKGDPGAPGPAGPAGPQGPIGP
jgi:hypothetical protein